MCFSATASFVAGGALSATGLLTVSKAKKRRELPLASIPLLFGIQQLIDGVVWVSFGMGALHTTAVYAYTLFAFVFWPVFVPLAVSMVEPNKMRVRILEALAIVGAGVGAFFAYFMVSGAVTAEIVNNCVAYDTPHPYHVPALAFYLVATCGAFFVSSKPVLRFFGVALLVSFSIAGWFYTQTFSSVWCFFAALLSAIIYWYFFRAPAR